MPNLHSDIPEHVKRQAMDAISHSETTAFIRLHGYCSDAVAPFSAPAREPAPGLQLPLTDDVKRQAVDAIAHRETKIHIRLVEDTGAVFAPSTPSRASVHAANRVTELHRSGAAVDSVQRQITQDGFGRFYE